MTGNKGDAALVDQAATRALHVEPIARETLDLLRKKGIPFHRGEPLDYFRKLARLGAALTLPIVPPEALRRAMFLKLLYPLWNIVVDDELDRAGTSAGLDASITLLTSGSASPMAPGAAAVAILERFAELLPGGTLVRSSPVGFGVWEAVNGFVHERFINTNPALATAFEYRRYSTMTASVKLFLDIDLGFASNLPDAVAYRHLRRAYDDLSCAIKLASDIGTLRREVHDENNLNLLCILAGSSGAPRPASEREANAAMADALRFKDEVAALAREHLRNARESCAAAPEVDTSGVLAAITRIVDVYTSGVDPFFA